MDNKVSKCMVMMMMMMMMMMIVVTDLKMHGHSNETMI